MYLENSPLIDVKQEKAQLLDATNQKPYKTGKK